MILKLKAKHFRGTKYWDNDCAIGQAIMDYGKANNIVDHSVGIGYVNIWGPPKAQGIKPYMFSKSYLLCNFLWDKFLSFFCKNERVIREIQINDLELREPGSPELSDLTVDELIQENRVCENELKMPI